MSIDPGIKQILPLDFIKLEMNRHPRIRSVGLNHFSYLLKRYWAGFCPEDGAVFLDPTLDPVWLARVLNERHPGLLIKPEEVWYFIFYHEAGHSLLGEDELQAEHYAKRAFVRWRNERDVAKKKIIQTIQDVVGEAIRESFKEVLAGEGGKPH